LTPDVGSDGVLSPAETFSPTFFVQLREKKSFRFFVDLMGVPGF
jgi:hypothetical protein